MTARTILDKILATSDDTIIKIPMKLFWDIETAIKEEEDKLTTREQSVIKREADFYKTTESVYKLQDDLNKGIPVVKIMNMEYMYQYGIPRHELVSEEYISIRDTSNKFVQIAMMNQSIARETDIYLDKPFLFRIFGNRKFKKTVREIVKKAENELKQN